MSRREWAYRLGVAGSIVVLVAVVGLWVANPGLTREQLRLVNGALVIVAFGCVGLAIGAHLRRGDR
jgi:hypothetical protein